MAMGTFDIGADTERRFQTLATHLQQAELTDAAEGNLGFVILQALTEGLLDGANVFPVTHIDKVDDDQATQVAQPQLAANFTGRFKVCFKSGRFDPAFARHFARVDINSDQGFRLVKYD